MFAPPERQPLFDCQENFANAEEPDHGDDKTEPAHEFDSPKGEAELTADDVHAHRPEDKPDQNRGNGFDGRDATEANEGAKRQELNAEELRRTKVQRKLGNERRKRSPG